MYLMLMCSNRFNWGHPIALCAYSFSFCYLTFRFLLVAAQNDAPPATTIHHLVYCIQYSLLVLLRPLSIPFNAPLQQPNEDMELNTPRIALGRSARTPHTHTQRSPATLSAKPFVAPLIDFERERRTQPVVSATKLIAISCRWYSGRDHRAQRNFWMSLGSGIMAFHFDD